MHFPLKSCAATSFRSFLASLPILWGFTVGAAAQEQPNILIIWGDDIGYWNISAYNQGMMGYETPNIDRIGQEGAVFTDAYGGQSCTAGRSEFITGQISLRTGLSKVGMPGADLGLKPEDPTIAEYLKSKGYMTGQFGKNHLGDKDEHLPTNHGFDEFFGNLYHLNAEEEPERPGYPKDPKFRERFGPRGVIKSSADGQIQDTGPLTRKRMETVDEEFLAASLDFIDRANKQKKPFFLWFAATRMHVFTHLKTESEGVTGLGLYPDGMVEHDGHVGTLLKKLDDLGIADNTIVMYSTDNGAEKLSWPDGGAAPFRGEKNSNWEGAYRVPLLVKWPGAIKAGSRINGIVSHQDWFPTLAAAVGEPDLVDKLKKAPPRFGEGNTTKIHIDGVNQLPYWKGETETPPRDQFVYLGDQGQVVGLRMMDTYKIVFLEQRGHGVNTWIDPFTPLRAPKIFNIRSDPFESADHESYRYGEWWAEHMWLMVPAQAAVAEFLGTFKEYPPRQTPASFSIDEVVRQMQSGGE